jgi:hypothetical protein
MAQKMLLIDDIDGSDADSTVTIALNGVAFEVDLSEKNIDKLNDLLAPYFEAGRQVSGRRGPATSSAPAKSTRSRSAVDNGAIRAWAKEQGIEVSERGRISNDVIEQYNAAQG